MTTTHPTVDLRITDLPRSPWAWLATAMIAFTLTVAIVLAGPSSSTDEPGGTTEQTPSSQEAPYLGSFVFGLPTVVSPVAPSEGSEMSMGGGGTPLFYN